jgi:hypothetical protein
VGPRRHCALRQIERERFLYTFQEAQRDSPVTNGPGELQFGKYSNADIQMNEITARAEEALKKIGQESDLNKRRVGKYGIKIED